MQSHRRETWHLVSQQIVTHPFVLVFHPKHRAKSLAFEPWVYVFGYSYYLVEAWLGRVRKSRWDTTKLWIVRLDS